MRLINWMQGLTLFAVFACSSAEPAAEPASTTEPAAKETMPAVEFDDATGAAEVADLTDLTASVEDAVGVAGAAGAAAVADLTTGVEDAAGAAGAAGAAALADLTAGVEDAAGATDSKPEVRYYLLSTA